MTRLNAATKALFQKPDIITNPLDLDAEFNTWDGRRVRYDINWAFYENTVYIEAPFRNWVRDYKTQFGLNKFTRSIYSPGYRLGEFWKSHLWAGSNIPLEFPDHVAAEDLLAAIRQIWEWSNWEANKDIVPLYGSVMGDVGILIVDDTEKEKVYFDVVHPGNIVAVERDSVGNVKGYELQEERDDPRQSTKELLANETNKTVTYSEIAYRNGGDVIYTTLLDGKPFPWNGESSWSKPYGFVPMVLIQHNNVGLQWGWSEIHPGQSKFREVDDQASKLNDQIRKMVDSAWVFFGVTRPEDSPTTTETSLAGTAAVNRPQPGREEIPALYGPEGGSAVPLVSDLNVGDVTANILQLIKEIERDYPELRLLALMDDTNFGNMSGRALRLVRQPSETKVRQRRPGYYNALVRANQMAVAIAGFNGYEGFGGFDLGSFDRGLLDHSIGQMPIFAVDPLDDLELSKETATIIKLYTDAGASLRQAALEAGLDEDEAAALASVDLSVLER